MCVILDWFCWGLTALPKESLGCAGGKGYAQTRVGSSAA